MTREFRFNFGLSSLKEILKKNQKLQGERPKYCEGPAEKSEACNTDPCEMQWSEWSPCNVNCGMGSRTRITKCAEVANGPVKAENSKKKFFFFLNFLLYKTIFSLHIDT